MGLTSTWYLCDSSLTDCPDENNPPAEGLPGPLQLSTADKRKDARRVALLFSLFNKTHTQLVLVLAAETHIFQFKTSLQQK